MTSALPEMTPFARRQTAVCALAVACLLLGPASADAASFKVGSFAKSTAAAPVTQIVPHGLAETPKAIIFWVSPDTAGAFWVGYRFAFGMTDGTTSMSAPPQRERPANALSIGRFALQQPSGGRRVDGVNH